MIDCSFDVDQYVFCRNAMPHAPLGESRLVKRQRREFLRLTAPTRMYDGSEARQLREYCIKNVLPLAAHNRFWQRALRWLKEFEEWARRFRRRYAREKKITLQVQSLKEMLAQVELCRLFIASLFKQKVGFSVPRAARRHLSGARRRLGHTSLNLDELLCDLIRGYERSMPRQVVQALSLEVDDVQRIAEAWGRSGNWWKVQQALLIALGFVGIFRMIEVRTLKIDSVQVVFYGGREVCLQKLHVLPKASAVKGIFVHLKWRKAQQCHNTWVPVACSTVIGLLLRHIKLMRRDGKYAGPLFTSRTRRGGRRSEGNWVDHKAAVESLREALVETCGMTVPQSKLYKGHSLRVGGSNHIRKLGIADEVHRLLGGWVSLVSSHRYFQLGEDEQLDRAEKYALKERAPPKVEGEKLIAMEAVASISIGG